MQKSSATSDFTIETGHYWRGNPNAPSLTLRSIPNLSHPVYGGHRYTLTGYLFIEADIVGGWKVGFDGPKGTLSAELRPYAPSMMADIFMETTGPMVFRLSEITQAGGHSGAVYTEILINADFFAMENGSVGLIVAQNVAEGETIVRAGSWFRRAEER